MKKTLLEDLKKIHSITYGDKTISENKIIDKILKRMNLTEEETPVKKIDDPKKADLVTANVEDFYANLKSAADGEGLKQREFGNMEYQKEVESMQIGLMILGYDLPKHGVDGLFGPETAAAVEKFKSDNNIKDSVNESADAIRQIAIRQYGWKEKSGQLSGGGEISSDLSKIVNELIAEFNEKYPECVGTFTSGNDQFHQNITSYTSLHTKGLAVDLTLPSSCHSSFIELLKQYKSKYDGFSYIDEYRNPTKLATGGHFHVSYRKGKPEGGGKSSGGSDSVGLINVTATPKMLTLLIDMLKQKGVTPEELKKYIDMAAARRSAGSVEISLTGDWVEITKNILRKNEGFSDVAKWDENAYRGGYGTDKKFINGRLVDATKETTWTRQEAEETMDYEIKNSYGPIVAKQLGQQNWDKLNDKQRAALVSLGYNVGPYFINSREYGRKIKTAIENGDMETAAAYIEKGPVTGSSSGKVYSGLVRRRKEEANIFLS